MIEYKYFEIINAAAMKADSINPDGSFVFKDTHEAELFRIDAEKNKISYDDASAVNEFKIDNTNIIIYPNFDRAVFNIPLIKKYDKEYCYYSKDEMKIIILRFDDNNLYSFYFSDEKNFGSKKSIEYSFSNIVYWGKIYELLCNKVSDNGADANRAFYINSFEKGKCIFEYSNYNPDFNNINLKVTYEHLLSTIELTNLYPMIFKNRCVEHLTDFGKSTLENLISELDEICNKVKTDFSIFVEKIDFDSYIQKYNERLSDFISQARNVIEKMLSNVFTLPLSYAGAVFAFDKLENDTFASFIFIAMLIYTIFTCGFLFYEFMDSFSIKKNFNKELRGYTNNSIFLLEKVKPDVKSINKRILIIRIICWILISAFIILLFWLWMKFFGNQGVAIPKSEVQTK